MEGTPFTEMPVTNYVDLDPTFGRSDYSGGIATYDGHDALDTGPDDFHRMDAGVKLYAAADGTVTSVHDGEFDRQVLGRLLDPSPPANYVKIDHGDGWETIYWHARRDSIQVDVGQTVDAGDFIAYVGSSGLSTDASVHFGLRHHGRPVEPFVDLASLRFVVVLSRPQVEEEVPEDQEVTDSTPVDTTEDTAGGEG